MKNSNQGKYKRIAMACQGGGSLGAYHIGVLRAMEEYGYSPNMVAGISIGAFVGSIIAGNEPSKRIPALEKFWEKISWPETPTFGQEPQGDARKFFNTLSSLQGFLFGQPGFFTPRFPGPSFQPKGTPAATSYYNTAKIRDTLLEFVDFEGINSGKLARLILGATNVKDGSLVFFDSAKMTIGPEHVIASGAMPPGFPGIEIDGELYWDGGCSSNTPLEGIFDAEPKVDTLCFMIDLFAATNQIPKDMDDVNILLKDIQFTSRTAHHIDNITKRKNLRSSVSYLLKQLPKTEKNNPLIKEIEEYGEDNLFEIIHLSYLKPDHEIPSADCEFSRLSIKDRQDRGYKDMKLVLEHAPWVADHKGFVVSRVHRYVGGQFKGTRELK